MLAADPGFNKSYLPAFWAARQLCWHKIRRRRPQKQNASRSLRGKKRGRAKIPSPQPPSFLPARASSLAPRSCGAVSSVQKRFGFRQTNAPLLNFQEFCRPIRPREARQRTETLARRARRGSPSAGSESLAILSVCFAQLKTNQV